MNRLPLAKIALWLLIGLTAFAFSAAGFLKLFGDEMYSDSFNAMGLPDVFGDVIAAGLASIMVGAVGYHLHYESLAEAVPAIILLVFSVIIVFARRRDNILYRTDSMDAA